MHWVKLSSLALFFPIKFVAVPWSGDTLKYFKLKLNLLR